MEQQFAHCIKEPTWRADLSKGLLNVASIYQLNFVPTPHDFNEKTQRIFKPWHWVGNEKQQGEYDK